MSIFTYIKYIINQVMMQIIPVVVFLCFFQTLVQLKTKYKNQHWKQTLLFLDYYKDAISGSNMSKLVTITACDNFIHTKLVSCYLT